MESVWARVLPVHFNAVTARRESSALAGDRPGSQSV